MVMPYKNNFLAICSTLMICALSIQGGERSRKSHWFWDYMPPITKLFNFFWITQPSKDIPVQEVPKISDTVLKRRIQKLVRKELQKQALYVPQNNNRELLVDMLCLFYEKKP